MKNKLTLSLLCSALAVGFVGVANATDKTESVNLTVLHTNDHHGHFWKNKHGEYGMAARKTLIDGIRKEVADKGGYSLLLSGGDINTGVPESDMQNAEPDFKGMTKLGYEAMALGNHEFDNPLDVLKQQEKWANFPFLAANIYDKKTGERLFKPYHIFNKGNIKIAVVGFTTEDTMKIGNPEYIADIEFRNPTDEAKDIIPTIKAQEKPDLIFAVTHMGHYQNANYGVNAPGDVTLARALPKGYLDMIIGGHSQNPVCMEPTFKEYDPEFKPGKACRPDQQNGTWIVQAHEWGKYVGRADFSFKDGKLTLGEYKLIPVNLKKKVKIDGKKVRQLVAQEIKEDPTMLEFLMPYQEKGQKALNVKIGSVDGKLIGDRDVVRFKQTNLGRLIAMAHKEKVNADFSVMNSGGVRDSIESGDITYKDVLKVQPFGNTVTKVTMKGEDVKKYLDVVATKSVDSGAYPQFAGLSMTVKKEGVHQVMINGKNLDMKQVYTFTVPSFNAAGGDGYPKLTDYIDTGFVDAEVLKTYIKTHSPLNIADFDPKNDVKFENQ